MGVALDAARRPADRGAAVLVEIGPHPEGEGAGVRQLNLAIDALLAEVAFAIGGELLGVRQHHVFVDAEGVVAFRTIGEPVVVVLRPFESGNGGFRAAVARGFDLGGGDLGLGFELADLEPLDLQFMFAVLQINLGIIDLDAADDVRGALNDLGVLINELVTQDESALLALFQRSAAIGALQVFEVELVVFER